MPSLIATLGANISGFVRDLDTAKGHASKAGGSIGSAMGDALSGALAGFASFDFLKRAVGDAADYAGKIEDIHQRLNISREALQAWDLVLSQNGSNVQAAVGFFEKLAVAREKALGGDAKAIKQFQDFGISLDQLKNKNVRSEDLGMDIGKAFEKGDPQKLIGSLKAIGGKAAGELIPAFRDGFAVAIEQAITKGISKTSVRELDKAGDAVTRAKAGFRAEVGEAAGTFLTRMRDFGDLFSGKLSFKDLLYNRGAKMRELREGGEKLPVDLSGEEPEEKTKAQIAQEAKLARLRADYARDEEAARLKAMTDAERLVALQEKASDLRVASSASRDEEKTIAINRELLKVYEDIGKLQKDMDKDVADEKKKARKAETDEAGRELSQIDKQESEEKRGNALARKSLGPGGLAAVGGVFGTLAASSEMAMLDLDRKSEQHLASIRRDIQKILRRSGDGGQEF